MAKRQYSDNDKATALAALDANGGNMKKTAGQLKIPLTTLQRWRDSKLPPEVTQLRNETRLELKDLIEAELYAVMALLPSRRHEATYSQLATVAGIFTDKMQLLAGKATERTEVIAPIDDTTRSSRIAALFDAARDRRDRQSPTPTDD